MHYHAMHYHAMHYHVMHYHAMHYHVLQEANILIDCSSHLTDSHALWKIVHAQLSGNGFLKTKI